MISDLFWQEKSLIPPKLSDNNDTINKINNGCDVEVNNNVRTLVNRVTDDVARRTDNLLNGYLEDKIVFIHIPKCGGSSITAAIASCYPQSDSSQETIVNLNASASLNASRQLDYPVFKYREALLMYFISCKKVRYIGGHFAFSETAYQNYHDEFKFITVLRNPIKRFISEYFYLRRTQKSSQHLKAQKPIEEYLDSPYGQRNGYQYVKFLNNPLESSDYSSRELIDRAKENLCKFDLVGFIEHQDTFVKQFEEKFGKKIRISKLNINPLSGVEKDTEITESIKERITEMCQPDLEIYNFALKQFIEQTR